MWAEYVAHYPGAGIALPSGYNQWHALPPRCRNSRSERTECPVPEWSCGFGQEQAGIGSLHPRDTYVVEINDAARSRGTHRTATVQ